MTRRDIAVVGGGLSGYATAIGLALEGFDTLLVAPQAERTDGRSTALIGESIAFLARLGLAEAIEAKGERLATMRIVDDTGRLLRAPTTEFKAAEVGLFAFGINILNADLLTLLKERAGTLSDRLTIETEPVRDISADADGASVTLADGRAFRVDLIVGADGRNSIVRRYSGIALRDWTYPQSAIVLNFSHAQPHDRISTEFHTPNGPFTQVPLPGRNSSLVWVDTPDAAANAKDLRTEKLAERIERRMHSILGAVEVTSEVQSFPLSGASAARMAGERTALVGEAAHVFPPIGAQGLNLGLRDAAALVSAVSASRDDPGSKRALGAYERARRVDVVSRTVGVDLLNRSLLAGFLPAQAGRAAGLAALSGLPFLRRFAIREGLSPGSGFRGLSKGLNERLGTGRLATVDDPLS
ncbi:MULTISPECIES: UbiH/UbiF family hydroxylase [unclassified Aureimonas]|uniref:UbiH/UbiF family hydroxylase n=1 Tax=unclassified Aureimonas TaxID=2615206 RepID=UPI0006FF786E|nr:MULTISPECIES: UbiH/UbiF family hydroxylase [unclassified Aureimonas]KQT60287.1 2-octaprenyl-6-methoxyphenyl hydroxylase [Aureimonas sp. Leaf427]KQT79163.1 2-octaprenyl-6-methoxyphenyl hydroxylase [Aureimonas sp. Leaf460]